MPPPLWSGPSRAELLQRATPCGPHGSIKVATNLSFFSHPWALATSYCQPGLSHPIFPQYTPCETPGQPSHRPQAANGTTHPLTGPSSESLTRVTLPVPSLLEPNALRFSSSQLFLIINVLARMSLPQSSCRWPLSITDRGSHMCDCLPTWDTNYR